ncbi:hypothetical protein TVAG_582940 [Trichomonas vaginalis G3]|uniref:Uncharacterized protein n=1 Tax=Trichomonas vaginalis (strain ATCC PRA-98 / G3) TaxID=412133 RepID=A2I2B4_TRIV3|nr:uncharacterized protein TVAGG3_1083670 [Trichomonas vaginalis G3]EAX64203.1 hypothetical protein TVAG_582940 [Trichomonas vaginalis G3]KAI5482589.1 hypothetical protein TVAGG3_1083670 [Trichomonas vaginalis G3]|eukprot:XP_001277133.1 hypothetical protein [Trichomonas vaginalis G3]
MKKNVFTLNVKVYSTGWMSPSEVMKNGRPEKWNSALRICIIRGIGLSLFGSCIHGRFAKNLRRASFFISFMSSTGVFSGI